MTFPRLSTRCSSTPGFPERGHFSTNLFFQEICCLSSVFIGVLALGTLLAGCGRNSSNVPQVPAPSSRPQPEIKSTADLARLLVVGMATNAIVGSFGTPAEVLPWGEGTVLWRYGLTPFTTDELSHVVGVEIHITNGHLAEWQCVYKETRWQRSAGPAMIFQGSGASASDTQETPLLKCFIVSSNPITGGRFIDTQQFPKLGFIPSAPGLVIRTVKEASLQEQRPNPGAPNPNLRIWAFDFSLTETDAARFAAFTEGNVDNRLLMMVGDEPFFSAFIREPIAGGNFEITTTNQVLIEQAKKLLANMARKK